MKFYGYAATLLLIASPAMAQSSSTTTVSVLQKTSTTSVNTTNKNVATGKGFTKAALYDNQRPKVMQSISEIKALATNIRAMFGEKTEAYTKSKYRGLNNRIAVEKSLVPDTLLKGITVDYSNPKATPWGYTLVNAWNGAVNVLSAPEEFGHRYFSITYSGLPESACVSLLTTNWGDEFLGHAFTCSNQKCFAQDKSLSDQRPPISEKEAFVICSGGGYLQVGFK